MYSKSSQNSIVAKTVNKAIEDVRKKHYLGSSNLDTNPTGGLNGYYRNVAEAVYKRIINSNRKLLNAFFVYLMDACITYTGCGNCGELAGALYLELLLSNLTLEQKKQVSLHFYNSNDSHEENSYVVVQSAVYDIWANKTYKKTKIERSHKKEEAVSPTTPVQTLLTMRKSIFDNFAKLFDEEIAKDRKNGAMYVTLDNKDTSNYSLLACDAFPYLFLKFKETVEDLYFFEHCDLATTLQGKILKNYVYLIEELRQDFIVSGSMALFHSNKRKYTQEEIAKALRIYISNESFVDFVLAMSYQHSNPQLALQLLLELDANLNPNSTDKLELSLVAQTSKLIIELKTKTGQSENSSTATSTQAFEEPEQANREIEDSTAIKVTEKELNPNQWFANSAIKEDVESSLKKSSPTPP